MTTNEDDIYSGRTTATTATTAPEPIVVDPPEMQDGGQGGVVAPPRRPGKPQHRRKSGSPVRNAIEWIVIIGAALLVALVIKQFLVQAFYIPSESMENTLKVGDRVLVNKLSYHLHDVHRGDVVVFKRPPSEAGEPAIKDLIKRVIGIPGDTLEGKDGKVFVNGSEVQEPYVKNGERTDNLPKQVIAPGTYFVMGDNRTNSKDARVFGPISRSLIVGRAFVRVYPIPKFAWL